MMAVSNGHMLRPITATDFDELGTFSGLDGRG
jgi:hypothetical protein